ncbi:hypothetical protein EYZ11_010252 [Aspergillus tanneri]|uniref:Uncharacterized protein n=1 Tax=Aspergillus tanneri TaxID=1220188 RepID=A0A4S3J5R9_9EURO|nr:hypothetical protein EYZ11_010252 [Aspergillus tanneri]
MSREPPSNPAHHRPGSSMSISSMLGSDADRPARDQNPHHSNTRPSGDPRHLRSLSRSLSRDGRTARVLVEFPKALLLNKPSSGGSLGYHRRLNIRKSQILRNRHRKSLPQTLLMVNPVD